MRQHTSNAPTHTHTQTHIRTPGQYSAEQKKRYDNIIWLSGLLWRWQRFCVCFRWHFTHK